MITQQSVETDKVAQEVVNELAEARQEAAEVENPYARRLAMRDMAYRHQLAAAQLRIERSLQAQQ